MFVHLKAAIYWIGASGNIIFIFESSHSVCLLKLKKKRIPDKFSSRKMMAQSFIFFFIVCSYNWKTLEWKKVVVYGRWIEGNIKK